MFKGVNSLLRNVRFTARRGGAIAKAVADAVFVAIAILVVTVGILATGSRLPNFGQDTTSRHTSKSSRMAECGNNELSPTDTDDTRPAARVLLVETPTHFWFIPQELPLPEMVGVPQAHGLRSPPTL
jgi:hypothetical protein